MNIGEFGTLQMVRTDEQHFGRSKVVSMTTNTPGLNPISSVSKIDQNTEAAGLTRTGRTEEGKSFANYLMEAVNTVNNQQMDVSKLQEKLVTSPDEVDIHDVTIAMSKARMSLNLAQTVIDRLVTSWNEISTTR